MAEYNTIYNALDGVMVVTKAWGCKAAYALTYPGEDLPDQLLPKWNHWSDIAYRGWIQVHTQRTEVASRFYPKVSVKSLRDKKMRPWLNFIVIQGIYAPDQTVQLILECLHRHNAGAWGFVPAWDNRMSFVVGSW